MNAAAFDRRFRLVAQPDVVQKFSSNCSRAVAGGGLGFARRPIIRLLQIELRRCPRHRSAALQVLKTLARFLKSGEGDTKQLRGCDPPLFRLRAQDYRVFFRDKDDTITIMRVLDRKEAYR